MNVKCNVAIKVLTLMTIGAVCGVVSTMAFVFIKPNFIKELGDFFSFFPANVFPGAIFGMGVIAVIALYSDGLRLKDYVAVLVVCCFSFCLANFLFSLFAHGSDGKNSGVSLLPLPYMAFVLGFSFAALISSFFMAAILKLYIRFSDGYMLVVGGAGAMLVALCFMFAVPMIMIFADRGSQIYVSEEMLYCFGIFVPWQSIMMVVIAWPLIKEKKIVQ